MKDFLESELRKQDFALEPDALAPLPSCGQPSDLLPSTKPPSVPDDAIAELPPDESARASKLFPNSFRVAGVKHVCDNLLSATLQGLPQLLDLLYVMLDSVLFVSRSNVGPGSVQS